MNLRQVKYSLSMFTLVAAFHPPKYAQKKIQFITKNHLDENLLHKLPDYACAFNDTVYTIKQIKLNNFVFRIIKMTMENSPKIFKSIYIT